MPTNEELRALAKEYGVELRITNPPALTKYGEIVLLPGIGSDPSEDEQLPDDREENAQ